MTCKDVFNETGMEKEYVVMKDVQRIKEILVKILLDHVPMTPSVLIILLLYNSI